MMVRAAGSLALLGILSACAGAPQHAQLSAPQEAEQYRARAQADYTPPGPPEDPWGPYIAEASKRYDLPEIWIRAVMHAESGAKQYRNGVLTVSDKGAMGLMQLMPVTYDEVSARNGLGSDPYDPHNNILAGTAFLRELYDAFGSPGFLAAYNGGPQRLEDYLTHNRPLPAETRHYVAIIGPVIAGVYPNNRSPAEQLAVNYLPINIPAGPRYQRHISAYALAARRNHGAHAQPTQYAALTTRGAGRAPKPPVVLPAAGGAIEVAEAPEPRSHGLHFIGTAHASENVPHDSSRAWGVQVGAFSDANQAHSAAAHAQGAAAYAHPAVVTVQAHGVMMYRARLMGMTRAGAEAACQKMGHGPCVVVSPATN